MSTLRPFPLPTRRFPPRWVIPPPRPSPRLWQDGRARTGIVILAVIVLGTVTAAWLSPYDPLRVDPSHQFQTPGLVHPWGTDLFGRDVLSRVLHGGRISLVTGAVAVLIACIPGTVLGLLAGYFGRGVDAVIMRSMDVMLSFPGILLALVVVATLGPGLGHVMVAVGIAGIPNYTRLVRGSVLVLRKALFVRAARVAGCSDWRIVVRHILPNVLGSVVVLTTVDVAWAILNASSLSFLGLGVQQPTPEWGAMLNEGRGYLYQAPWIAMGPGLMLMLTILAINLLGDGLRDALDPRLKNQTRG
jgi:peptide/nickel transport system permease protein